MITLRVRSGYKLQVKMRVAVLWCARRLRFEKQLTDPAFNRPRQLKEATRGKVSGRLRKLPPPLKLWRTGRRPLVLRIWITLACGRDDLFAIVSIR
jgi:hypothetical protein